MKTEANIAEVKVIFKKIMEAPERMFEMFRIDMKQACERAVTELIKVELTRFLGREKYQRTAYSDPKSEDSYRQKYSQQQK